MTFMYSFDEPPVAKTNKKQKSVGKTLGKISLGLLVVFIAIGALSYFFILRPALKIREKGVALAQEVRVLKTHLKENDIDLLKKTMKSVNEKYASFEKESSSLYWAAFIPYINDFKSAVEAGRFSLIAADEAIEAIYPYADLIGLKKGEQNFYEKTAEDRLQTAVLTLDKMLKRIDVVAENISQAEKRIESIDPKRYPSKLGKYEVRSQVQSLKDQFAGMATLFVNAKPFLKELPSILGAKGEKTYLILFQNTAERRATGGFFTFYAVFNINKGKIAIKSSSDIYDIDSNIASHPSAPDKILAYHKDVKKFYIRDSNLSPDFVESVKLFESLYEKAGNRVKYDGIIAVDSKVLVDMLSIFGDTQVSGINFSASIDKRCDCPQVIYTLFDIVDRPVPYIKIDRKRILGNLMLELFYKAIGFSPSKYWGRLAQTMFANLDEKHIILYFTDEKTQAAIESMNYAGRIKEYKGDYLHINNVNFAGAKSNLFIDEEIISETTFEGSAVKRTVIMKFKNPHPHSDCNLERGGLCLNATLRNWIRFYVPKGAKLESFSGSQTKTLTYDDLGKTVFEGFMTVNPQGSAQVKITYTLPTEINSKNYSLLLQKQPGVERQKVKVSVDGNTYLDQSFLTDKEVKP